MKKNKLILFLLTLIFVAPSLSAYLLYKHPSWRSTHTINKGQLLPNAPQLEIFDEKKWHILLWSPEPCTNTCMKDLRQLNQLRLALGRRYYDVDLSAVSPFSPSEDLTQQMQTEHIRWVRLHAKDKHIKPLQPYPMSVFIATPQGHLILHYHQPIKLDDIYRDIKHLLTTSDGKNVS